MRRRQHRASKRRVICHSNGFRESGGGWDNCAFSSRRVEVSEAPRALIRLTPTFEQFRAIVASIRAQTFNRDRDDSADFVEFMGLSGLGQAEMGSIKRSDVDLTAGRIVIYRHKTSKGFVILIYPQLRPLIERLCEGKAHDARLFAIREARKALENACKRSTYPQFTHRSLRRMFITRALERGVDVKVIAGWQGHSDGGKLILQTYSHVAVLHAERMAQLMNDVVPANVVPLEAVRREDQAESVVEVSSRQFSPMASPSCLDQSLPGVTSERWRHL